MNLATIYQVFIRSRGKWQLRCTRQDESSALDESRRLRRETCIVEVTKRVVCVHKPEKTS